MKTKADFHFRVYTLWSGLLVIVPMFVLCIVMFWLVDHYGPVWADNKIGRTVAGAIPVILAILLSKKATIPIKATITENGVSFTPESSFGALNALEQSMVWGQIAWWRYDNTSNLGHGDALVDIFTIQRTDDGHRLKLYIFAPISQDNPFDSFLYVFESYARLYNQNNPTLSPIIARQKSTGSILKHLALFIISTAISGITVYIICTDFDAFAKKWQVLSGGLVLMGWGSYFAGRKLWAYYRE